MNAGLRLFDVLFVLPIYQAYGKLSLTPLTSLNLCFTTASLNHWVHAGVLWSSVVSFWISGATVNGILYFEEYHPRRCLRPPT
jgi:hypothetical protein|eukprot:COSAG01_NODE_388_length_17730_cov_13.231978_20_plen_83_part_00